MHVRTMYILCMYVCVYIIMYVYTLNNQGIVIQDQGHEYSPKCFFVFKYKL